MRGRVHQYIVKQLAVFGVLLEKAHPHVKILRDRDLRQMDMAGEILGHFGEQLLDAGEIQLVFAGIIVVQQALGNAAVRADQVERAAGIAAGSKLCKRMRQDVIPTFFVLFGLFHPKHPPLVTV